MNRKLNALKQAREDRQMNLQQAANMLRVSVSTYWNWEMGSKFPNKKNLLNIRKNFGVTPDMVLEISPAVKKDKPKP